MTHQSSDVILQRMMALHPKIIDLTLDRVYRLLGAVGNPHLNLPPVIHIAGTNGKGSTQAFLRAGLEADGKRVQAYTSPHLARFHERIRLSDGLISEPHLQEVLAECEAANGDVPITYFEITTVAALLAFSRDPADYCLLEVGLGGRLDATNVIDAPAMTVITPVSIDHQQFLGDTIEAIAGEKAGIIKAGAPLVVGRQAEAAGDVITERAQSLGAPAWYAGQDFQSYEEHWRLVYQDENGLLDLPLPALPGAHQIENAGTALAVLRRLGTSDAACAKAMEDVKWLARMQRLTGPIAEAHPGLELWLDGGHNTAAGEAIGATLATLSNARPTFVICGMLNTKDVSGYMQPLAEHTSALYAVSIPGEAATLSAAQTAEAARCVGIEASTSDSVWDALDAIARDTPNARVLICGSLYLAGHVLRENV
jgi:dihydrofolate synthase/folylpolyglutamate synthase